MKVGSAFNLVFSNASPVNPLPAREGANHRQCITLLPLLLLLLSLKLISGILLALWQKQDLLKQNTNLVFQRPATLFRAGLVALCHASISLYSVYKNLAAGFVVVVGWLKGRRRTRPWHQQQPRGALSGTNELFPGMAAATATSFRHNRSRVCSSSGEVIAAVSLSQRQSYLDEAFCSLDIHSSPQLFCCSHKQSPDPSGDACLRRTESAVIYVPCQNQYN